MNCLNECFFSPGAVPPLYIRGPRRQSKAPTIRVVFRIYSWTPTPIPTGAPLLKKWCESYELTIQLKLTLRYSCFSHPYIKMLNPLRPPMKKAVVIACFKPTSKLQAPGCRTPSEMGRSAQQAFSSARTSRNPPWGKVLSIAVIQNQGSAPTL